MKRKLLSFAALFSALFVLSSCLNTEEDETVYYGDTAISSFSVGTLKRTLHKVSSTGSDSTVTSTLDCSGYKFYIDQINGLIYNVDSLPVGVDVAKVVCTVNAKNSGTVVYKSLTSDSLRYYSSTDSIDFTQPREFQVIALQNENTTASRSYTVKVNVHKEVADTFVWNSLTTTNAGLGALTAMKGYAMGGYVYVVGNQGTTTRVLRTAESDGKTWTVLAPNVALDAEAYHNIAIDGNTAYLLNGGTLYTSTDFTNWTTAGTPAGVKQLLGWGTKKLYAVAADGGLTASTDKGANWTAEQLDGDKTLLPTENLTFVCRRSNTNTDIDMLTLIGNRADSYATDSTAMVWGKVEELEGNSESWMYYPIDRTDKYKAPRLENLQVVYYNGSLHAIGGNGLGASTAKAFDRVYQSENGGLNWPKDSDIVIPTGFDSSTTSFTMVADSQQNLWIVCGTSGQVWKGHITSLAWKKEQKIYR